MDLALRRLGSGPPVLYLHGLLGSGRNWQGVATALQDRFEAVLIDLRNHGASPWDEEVGYGAMAADVAGLMDRLGLRAARVVGHSMGGKVAMTLALQAPERVEHLVVVDIAPVPYPPGLEALLQAMRAVDLPGLKRRAEVDAALSASVPDAGVRGFLVQNLEQAGGALRWRVNLDALLAGMATIRGFPELDASTPFQGPVEVIRGAGSDYVTEAGMAAMRALFPTARLHTVARAGHWVHAEQPAAFLDTLRGCLGEP